jgi:hypothetical protein
MIDVVTLYVVILIITPVAFIIGWRCGYVHGISDRKSSTPKDKEISKIPVRNNIVISPLPGHVYCPMCGKSTDATGKFCQWCGASIIL